MMGPWLKKNRLVGSLFFNSQTILEQSLDLGIVNASIRKKKQIDDVIP